MRLSQTRELPLRGAQQREQGPQDHQAGGLLPGIEAVQGLVDLHQAEIENPQDLVALRMVPHLRFELDPSLKKAEEVYGAIDQAKTRFARYWAGSVPR